MEQNKKKKVLEIYMQSPDSKKANIYLYGIYLLLSIQLAWADEAFDIMSRYHVITHEFKSNWTSSVKQMERLEMSMRSSISTEVKKMEAINDFENVYKIMTNFIFGGTLQDGKGEE